MNPDCNVGSVKKFWKPENTLWSNNFSHEMQKMFEIEV